MLLMLVQMDFCAAIARYRALFRDFGAALV
jgi:hypothetical protein